MGRELHWETVDHTLSPTLRSTIRRLQATAIVVFGEPTSHPPFQVWLDGEDLGYVATQADALAFLRRLAGPDGWTTAEGWE